jgi:DNA-binding SARP family transcriptional activator/tetratricopeptide (TPR) repeat protein
MEVRVLGPVEVSHDDLPVRFARRQQRLVLGILALRPNEPMAGERLIDLLWGQHPPARARAVLQSRVSELRTVLTALPQPDPHVRIDATGTGYLLQAPPDRIDAHRFEDLVARGRAAPTDEERRTLLRAALELWRGPVLGDQLTPSSAVTLGAPLEAARLTAAEDLLEVELRLGNHHRIADEASRWASDHPTRERFVGQMLRALSRTGRAVEALRAYHNWRGWLREELGTDPSDETEAIYVSVLRGTTTPAEPAGADPPAAPGRHHAAVPRTLPPDIADFSGRRREVDHVRALLRRRVSGQVAIAAVTGPGGAGKTTLAVHVAHAVAADFPDGQLYVNLRGNDHDLPVEPFEVLGRFLRLLGVDGLALPETVEERVDLYRSLLADRGVLILLDNAAGDPQVQPLLPNSAGCAVIVTGRLHLGATLGVQPVRLDVMDEAEALELLRRVGGPARTVDGPDAAELARRCGHLPLALRIVAAKLAAKPHWSAGKIVTLLDDEQQRLDRLSHGPLDVRASIALSYAHLRPAAQRLLCRLGDFDLPDVSVWLSAALLDCRPDVAEDLLEQLLDAQLLQPGAAGGDHPRYRLHDLVRIFARERAAAELSRDELEAARTRGFGAYLFLLDVLVRAAYGGDYRMTHGPATRWPADERLAAGSEAELLEWFDIEQPSIVAVIRRAAGDGRSPVAWDLACTAAVPLTTRRQFDEVRTVLDLALATTLRAGDQRGEAATRNRLGLLYSGQERFDAGEDEFARAYELFQRVGDRHGQALVSASLGMHHRSSGRPDAAMDYYAAALAGLRIVGDQGEIAHVLRGIGRIQMERGDHAEADATFEQALTVFDNAGGSSTGRAQVLFWQGMLRTWRGDFTTAEQLFEEVLRVTVALGDRSGQAQALRGLAICQVQRGDRATGRATLDEALAMLDHVPSFVGAQLRSTIAELFGDAAPRTDG